MQDELIHIIHVLKHLCDHYDLLRIAYPNHPTEKKERKKKKIVIINVTVTLIIALNWTNCIDWIFARNIMKSKNINKGNWKRRICEIGRYIFEQDSPYCNLGWSLSIGSCEDSSVKIPFHRYLGVVPTRSKDQRIRKRRYADYTRSSCLAGFNQTRGYVK